MGTLRFAHSKRQFIHIQAKPVSQFGFQDSYQEFLLKKMNYGIEVRASESSWHLYGAGEAGL